MKAWRLSHPGGKLRLADRPVPELTAGSVLVRLQARPLLSYLGGFVAGRLTSLHPPEGEFTPGTDAVGVVEQVGPEVYGLAAGQRVYVSAHHVVAENVAEPLEGLIGLTAEPASAALLRGWPDGSLAELMLAPAACVTAIPQSLQHVSSNTLAALSRCLVPYGGFLRGRLAPGETVIVHGATGAFGTAGVHVAVAMGAAVVIAAGRNPDALKPLAGLPRVRTVQLTGDDDTGRLREAANGGADLALDLVGQADSADGTLATFDALRRRGRLVLMGSMTVPLSLPYAEVLRTGREVVGNFMYPASAPAGLLALVASGQLDLRAFEVETRPLADLVAAMERAGERGAPLVVLG